MTELTLCASWPEIQGLIEWETVGMMEPYFPLLESLTISFSDEDDMEIEEFEVIVQQRCLPSSHPASKLHVGIKPLAKLVISASGSWRSSGFLADTTMLEEDEGLETVSLSWI